jgi:hypothetical protein|tara:strand:- start:69 stop:854 length:786 start_codon:yes stop_codon:yes gene_type:complete
MKKLLLVFTLLLGLSAYAQDGPYLVRTHEIRVEGNVAAFIDAQKTYYKAIAKDAVDRDKWAGWACFQSITDPNNFVFMHHFNNPEQLENLKPMDIWSNDIPKKLGLWQPDSSTYSVNATSASQHVYQIAGNVLSGDPSNYFYVNLFKASNASKFAGNNDLWGKEVIKPQLGKGNNPNNWAYGFRLTNPNWNQNGGMITYNGISFDGYESLSSILHSAAYDADAKPSKFQENFNKKAAQMEVADGFQEIHRTLYRVIDDTWR